MVHESFYENLVSVGFAMGSLHWNLKLQVMGTSLALVENSLYLHYLHLSLFAPPNPPPNPPPPPPPPATESPIDRIPPVLCPLNNFIWVTCCIRFLFLCCEHCFIQMLLDIQSCKHTKYHTMNLTKSIDKHSFFQKVFVQKLFLTL